MTKKDYIWMAKWISANTSPDEEWWRERDLIIRFACSLAIEADKTKGNQKSFKEDQFLRAIKHYDEEEK